MLLSSKYKLLYVSIDGKGYVFPTIAGSYLYTLWVLNHKYKVILHEIKEVTYSEVKQKNITILGEYEVDKTKHIPYTIPNTTSLLCINNFDNVLSYLGADACILLEGTQIIPRITQAIRRNPRLNKTPTKVLSFYDAYIIEQYILTPKVARSAPKLYGIPFYQYTVRNRKAFNRRAEVFRKLLGIDTCTPTLKKKKKKENQSN
jgi:hypothetical protein